MGNFRFSFVSFVLVGSAAMWDFGILHPVEDSYSFREYLILSCKGLADLCEPPERGIPPPATPRGYPAPQASQSLVCATVAADYSGGVCADKFIGILLGVGVTVISCGFT